MIDEYLESKVTTATPYQLHLMVIDGAIRHAGKPPNRNCTMSRFTFAIKLRV